MDKAAFLTARLDEDAEIAKKLQQWASEGDWDTGGDFEVCLIEGVVGPFGGQTSRRTVGIGVGLAAIADPARVLREVAAKRAIVDDYVTTCRVRDEAAARISDARASGRIDSDALDDWNSAAREAPILEDVVLRLASPYADHPDYKPAWNIEP